VAAGVADRTVDFAKITRVGQIGLFDPSFPEDVERAIDHRRSFGRRCS
jgi:hypothetical protein